MIRSFLLAYIALSLFLSQANLPLFTHICHGMGMTWTALVKPPKACCGKIKRKEYAVHCRKILSNVVVIDKEPCCEDHVDYVSLSVQVVHQFAKVQTQTKLYHSIAPAFLHGFSISAVAALDVIVQDNGPPRQLSGRNLLIAYQLFLC